MGDLNVSENFVDRIYIKSSATGLAATGLAPTCVIIDELGNRSNGTVAEMASGWYKITDFTPDAVGTWCLEWAVAGNYAIVSPFKIFKVGGGALADLQTYVAAGTGSTIPANTSIYDALTFQQQADAVLSQANPVSATLYTVLATNTNVQVISIAESITWAVTQPTPLEVVMTIDGLPITYLFTNPVSNTSYDAVRRSEGANTNQILRPSADLVAQYTPFLLEGRSVSVQVRITWAITQPTPLVGRVKWAKR